MAPILKETEASASTPAPPHAKVASESPTRTQPIALEIPVSVNGARTVDGSDKRVPFSEATQTVLVLPHGAVVRIATPLASGQLVFLTNEKTKKEVVCQVVKSKSTGGTAAYVELQFTEPAPGFWGIQVPGGAAVAPPAHRPVAPVPSGVAKPTVPAPIAVSKPPVAPKPVASPVASIPVVKPVAPITASPTVQPVAPSTHSVSPASIVPELSSAPLSAAPDVTQAGKPVAPVESQVKSSELVVPATPATTPSAPAPHHAGMPAALPLHDYSKEINALFTSGQAPVAPAAPSHAAPTAAAPTTEDLKLQAARLQAQLSSMLFTETQADSKIASAPARPKPEASMADTIKKVVEIREQDFKPVAPVETKLVAPAKKPAPAPIGLDEEVKVPSWLAPLSQTVSAEPAEPAAESANQAVSVNSEESFDALVTEAPRHAETAVFGGQLFGELAGASAGASSKGSKTGLFIGLAAAAVLIAGAGGWYYHQNYSAPAAVSAARSTNVSNAASAPVATAPATPTVSTPAASDVHSAPVVTPKPSKRTAPEPVAAATAPAPERRNSDAAAKNAQPVETPAKTALGDVHLAAPIVPSGQSEPVGDAVPSIDAKSVPAGGDPFAVAGRHTPPAAPLPIGGDVKPAQLIKSVPPEYPEIAKAQHVSGKVQIDALVDASGNVATVKVVSGPMLLRKAALDAVKQWKYTPARLDDQATSMHLTVTVEFRGQ
jgi:periplasmic protein TonB